MQHSQQYFEKKIGICTIGGAAAGLFDSVDPMQVALFCRPKFDKKMTEWISTKRAMQMLGVGSTTVKRWADEGALPSSRTVGGHRRFREDDVKRLLERLHGTNKPKPESAPDKLK